MDVVPTIDAYMRHTCVLPLTMIDANLHHENGPQKRLLIHNLPYIFQLAILCPFTWWFLNQTEIFVLSVQRQPFKLAIEHSNFGHSTNR